MIKPFLFLFSAFVLNTAFVDEYDDQDDLNMYGYETVTDSENDYYKTSSDFENETVEFNPEQMMDEPGDQDYYTDEYNNPTLYPESYRDLSDGEEIDEGYSEFEGDEDDEDDEDDEYE